MVPLITLSSDLDHRTPDLSSSTLILTPGLVSSEYSKVCLLLRSRVTNNPNLLCPSHLISSIFLILIRCLRLVKTRAAVAVPRMMMMTPTKTLVPALYTEERLAAAAARSLSLEAEEGENDCLS